VNRRRGTTPAEAEAEPTRVGTLEIDRRARRVTVGDDEVALTVKEYELLAALAADPGAVVTRKQLLEQVWETSWYGSTKTIDVHVASLRRKLGDPGWVETVRGVGFRLNTPA
jgi:DNA-binding response OmpR family regulator